MSSQQFIIRRYIITAIILVTGAVFILRLLYLQVINKKYRMSASNIALEYVIQYPARGLIYDRNGNLMAYNQASYDIVVYPNRLQAFDTTELCGLLEIDKEWVISGIAKAKEYSYYKPTIFLKQVSPERYAIFQEKLHKFPGFSVQSRTLRKYTKEIASHALGYVSEVNPNEIKKSTYYKQGDYIGKSGIEKTYEIPLRGQKGLNIYVKDVHNQIKGAYMNGKYDTLAVVGSNLITTLDADLQEYCEKLFVNKMGSVVAIEPATGEILAMVSAPTYEPGSIIGRKRSENFANLNKDTLKPLFNRALMAQYPPGSTFKVVNALIGLEEQVVHKNYTFPCNRGYYASGHFVGCHLHDSPLNLVQAIQKSCNAYFCNVFRNILDNKEYSSIQNSFDQWNKYVVSFGFGDQLGIDLPNEVGGIVASKNLYNRVYGEKGWKSITVVSLAIGQGELGITPLQMANMSAAIANRGYYYIPHVVKQIEGNFQIDPIYLKKFSTEFDSAHIEIAIKGMELAVNGGEGSTSRLAKLDDIVVCGKTGTAQNPHGEDHSIFIAFAPKDDPKIAISVYVENAGFGSTWAVPIAALAIEKYLKGSISRVWLENYVLNGDLIHKNETKED